jgi:hypothetical protein
MFLQHLSMVGYMLQHNINVNTSDLPPPRPHSACQSPHFTTFSGDNMLTEWLDEVKICWSEDGSIFSDFTPVITTCFDDTMSYKVIQASDVDIVDIFVKSLRICPIKWKGTTCSLKLHIKAFEPQRDVTEIEANSSIIDSVSAEVCIQAIDLLQSSTELLAEVTDDLVKINEISATRSQEEALKKMESIVDEKIAHEQALLDEKLALNSEKCSLEEQLKSAMQELRDMEKSLIREKTLREQLETLCNSLDMEKRDLVVLLNE